MRREDPLDLPFLPSVGQVYLAVTIMFQPADKKARRPVVVVGAPLSLRGRVAVVARTSDTDEDGVAHAADLGLGLDKNGVFARLKSTEAQLWTPRNVLLRGLLPAAVLRDVIARWYE